MIIDILGTKYSVIFTDKSLDPILQNLAGYCDETSKKIVINNLNAGNVENFAYYRSRVLRHEVIHAYLFESGLCDNQKHPENGHDEEMIDWFATQYPKIKKTFKELKIEN